MPAEFFAFDSRCITLLYRMPVLTYQKESHLVADIIINKQFIYYYTITASTQSTMLRSGGL